MYPPVRRTQWARVLAAVGLSLGAVAFAVARSSPVAPDSQAPTRPILIELFTSQSCSSCPPADALLRGLSGSPDLLPLSFHVDYWNGLGWVDPYSSPVNTARQRDYALRHGFQVYTPQMVIDGHEDVVGSDRGAVVQALLRAETQRHGAPATIQRNGSTIIATVGAVPDGSDLTEAQAFLISFDPSLSAHVGGGENAGRNLSYTNVVRSIRKVGEWRNRPVSFSDRVRADESGKRLALIVQDASGTVWAIATTPPS